MATTKKIIELIAAAKTVYPYYAKETNTETLVKTWGLLLADFPDAVTEKAFFRCLQICKMPPTPADVIEQIREMQKVNEPSDAELWDVYYKALRNTLRLIGEFRYTYVDATGISQGEQARRKVQEIWDGLPEKIKVYLGTKSELMRKAEEMNTEETTWERQRFYKTLPIVAKRIEYTALDFDGLLRLDGSFD